jgi:hypothetical protein
MLVAHPPQRLEALPRATDGAGTTRATAFCERRCALPVRRLEVLALVPEDCELGAVLLPGRLESASAGLSPLTLRQLGEALLKLRAADLLDVVGPRESELAVTRARALRTAGKRASRPTGC